MGKDILSTIKIEIPSRGQCIKLQGGHNDMYELVGELRRALQAVGFHPDDIAEQIPRGQKDV